MKTAAIISLITALLLIGTARLLLTRGKRPVSDSKMLAAVNKWDKRRKRGWAIWKR